jgi:hypothetical protein
MRKWNQEKEIKKRVIMVEKMVEKSAIHVYIVYQQLTETQPFRTNQRIVTKEFI